MRKEDVETLPSFVKHVENSSFLSELTVFRGQPESGGLLPTVARDDPTRDTTTSERETLEQLRLMGASFLQPSNMSELDLLVLAQHFGLKTRLLDWTSNPLAALWFACSDFEEGDVYVYALEADGLQAKDVYEQGPFEQKRTQLFQPRLNNARITAQHGWFTLHRYSKGSGKFVALESNADLKSNLTEYRVPGERRPEMLKSLDRHGINRRALFPDLEGLCKHLNWKFSKEK